MTKVLKFDGKSLKEGSETLCHVDGKYIKLGASDSKSQLSGFIMCRVEGNLIKDLKDDDAVACRVEGKDIKEGNNFSPSTVY